MSHLQSGAVAGAVAQPPRRQHGREGIAGTHRVHEQLVLHHLTPALQALRPPAPPTAGSEPKMKSTDM